MLLLRLCEIVLMLLDGGHAGRQLSPSGRGNEGC